MENMVNLLATQGDITKLAVDAIANAANTAMRGGGGVDGAIHRAAGPQLLAECIERFPRGLPTGQAGWTHGWNLPAHWVIHTPGPNYGAGQRDPALLEASYRNSFEVACQLSCKSLAFPLISAGVYRWPRQNAIEIAVGTLASCLKQGAGSVSEITLVALEAQNVTQIQTQIDALSDF